jgi:hypothetical protein
MNKETSCNLGEVASFELLEDDDKGQFTIAIRGKLHFGDMIVAKLQDLVFSIEDVRESVREGNDSTRSSKYLDR